MFKAGKSTLHFMLVCTIPYSRGYHVKPLCLFQMDLMNELTSGFICLRIRSIIISVHCILLTNARLLYHGATLMAMRA